MADEEVTCPRSCSYWKLGCLTLDQCLGGWPLEAHSGCLQIPNPTSDKGTTPKSGRGAISEVTQSQGGSCHWVLGPHFLVPLAEKPESCPVLSKSEALQVSTTAESFSGWNPEPDTSHPLMEGVVAKDINPGISWGWWVLPLPLASCRTLGKSLHC